MFVSVDGDSECLRTVRTVSLTGDEWQLRSPTSQACVLDAAAGGWPSVHSSWRNPYDTALRPDANACSSQAPSSWLPRLEDGRLHMLGVSARDVWLADQPLEGVCPSRNDPCGLATRFAPLRDSSSLANFWVATDESAAVAIEAVGPGRAAIWLYLPDAIAPTRRLTVDADAADVLGVRFHARASLLARLIDDGWPPGREEQ